MARNYFADPMQTGEEAFDRAFDRQQGITNRITTTRAGRQLAGGDRAGAGRTFAGAGMINEARVLESDQLAADTRMRQDRERESAGMKARDAEQEAAKVAQAEAMLAILKRLQTVPAGQRSATLQRAAPILQSVGMDPTPFLSMPETDLSDEALTVATGEAAKAYDQYFNTSAGVVGVKQRTGEAALVYDAPDKPIILGPDRVAIQGGEVIGRGPAKTFAPPRASAGRSGGAAPKPPPGFILD